MNGNEQHISIKTSQLVGFAFTLVLAIGGTGFSIYQSVSENITNTQARLDATREIFHERVDHLKHDLKRLEENDRIIIQKLDRLNTQIK